MISAVRCEAVRSGAKRTAAYLGAGLCNNAGCTVRSALRISAERTPDHFWAGLCNNAVDNLRSATKPNLITKARVGIRRPAKAGGAKCTPDHLAYPSLRNCRGAKRTADDLGAGLCHNMGL